MTFWACSYVWLKQAYASFHPIALVTLRLLVSIPLLLTIGIRSKKIKLPSKSDIKWFCLLAIFEPFLYFLAESYGVRLISSTLASVIITTIPLFTPIVIILSTKERYGLMTWLGTIVSIAGVCLMISQTESEGSSSWLGVVLMFVSVFSSIGYALVLKKMVHKYNGITIVTWQNTIGTIYFLPLFFSFDFDTLFILPIEQESWIAFFQLCILGSVVAFLCFAYGIKELGVTLSNAFINLMPVITAIATYLVLGEVLNYIEWVAIAIVILGLSVSQMNTRGR